MGFKENLKNELDYQGLQLKELSAKCGISKNTLGNYITGHNSLPSIETGVKIAHALNVTAEYLVNGSENLDKSFSSLPLKYRKMMEALDSLDNVDFDAVYTLALSLQKRYKKK